MDDNVRLCAMELRLRLRRFLLERATGVFNRNVASCYESSIFCDCDI